MQIGEHKFRDSRVFDGHFVSKDKIAKPEVDPGGLTPIGEPTEKLVYYVNGINTSIDKQLQDMRNIASYGHKVIGIHNATAGVTWDVGQCIADKMNWKDNGAVKTLKKLLKQNLETGLGMAIVGHSQGALICSRALWEVKDELLESGLSEEQAREKLSKIELETAGGAAHRYPDGPQYNHIVNSHDPVPGMFGLNSYIPGKKPGEGADISVESLRNEAYTKPEDSWWDLIPNYFDRTVHGVEVYYDPARAPKNK